MCSCINRGDHTESSRKPLTHVDSPDSPDQSPDRKNWTCWIVFMGKADRTKGTHTHSYRVRREPLFAL
ncbi:hypothetical protein MHYP_G00293580 [Metynnis hypsauchen]